MVPANSECVNIITLSVSSKEFDVHETLPSIDSVLFVSKVPFSS